MRYVLALALVTTVPLAIWSGGCGTDTVVEPPGDGGLTDSATSGHDGASDAVDATDANDGGALQCCSMAEGNQTACSPDGAELLTCTYYFAAGPSCVESSTTSYGYVWLASRCPSGCAKAMATSSTAAHCQ